MKLANLRRILGDALLNNFQVVNGLSEIKISHRRGILGDSFTVKFRNRYRTGTDLVRQ